MLRAASPQRVGPLALALCVTPAVESCSGEPSCSELRTCGASNPGNDASMADDARSERASDASVESGGGGSGSMQQEGGEGEAADSMGSGGLAGMGGSAGAGGAAGVGGLGTGGGGSDGASDACVTETDAAFCGRLGKNCDAVTGTDNCGKTRTVMSCGVARRRFHARPTVRRTYASAFPKPIGRSALV